MYRPNSAECNLALFHKVSQFPLFRKNIYKYFRSKQKLLGQTRFLHEATPREEVTLSVALSLWGQLPNTGF